MTINEMVHKLVEHALRKRRFFPEFQIRTDPMDDIAKNKKNIKIGGFGGKNSKLFE